MSHHKSMRPRQGADSKSLDAPYDQESGKMKPREFWIMLHGNGLHSEEALLYYQEPCEPMKSLSKHLIEKSAYDALKLELDKARAELVQLNDNYNFTGKERNKFCNALNQIAMLGSSGLAYTSEFTEKVLNIAHRALTGRERGL